MDKNLAKDIKNFLELNYESVVNGTFGGHQFDEYELSRGHHGGTAPTYEFKLWKRGKIAYLVEIPNTWTDGLKMRIYDGSKLVYESDFERKEV